jgi:hypothetical protein
MDYKYQTLLAVSEAIVSHRDLSALFHELAGRLHQVVRFDYLGLALHEATSNTLRVHLLEGTRAPCGVAPEHIHASVDGKRSRDVSREIRMTRFNNSKLSFLRNVMNAFANARRTVGDMDSNEKTRCSACCGRLPCRRALRPAAFVPSALNLTVIGARFK